MDLDGQGRWSFAFHSVTEIFLTQKHFFGVKPHTSASVAVRPHSRLQALEPSHTASGASDLFPSASHVLGLLLSIQIGDSIYLGVIYSIFKE